MATDITTNRLITPSVQALFKGSELYIFIISFSSSTDKTFPFLPRCSMA